MDESREENSPSIPEGEGGYALRSDEQPGSEPTEPTEVAEEPTESNEVTELAEPTEPIESAEPAEPTESNEATEPAEPTEPIEPTEPAEPTELAEPTESVEVAEKPKSEKLIGQFNRAEAMVKRYQWLVLKLFLIIFILWALFFNVVGITHMPSNDMFPRIDAGDLVLFSRLDTDVAAQDVVVFEKATPDSDGERELFIGRVVAREGDVVDIKDNALVVNGDTIWENKIFYPTYAYEKTDVEYPVKLGTGQCFVLVDKRDEGADSRFFGPVEHDEVLGTVITILRRTNL